MTTYVKSSDSIIDVVDAKGKPLRVTRRAYDVVYKAKGYKLASEVVTVPKQKESKKEDAKKEK